MSAHESSELGLCLLIERMSSEQVDRCLSNDKTTPILFEHMAACMASTCKNALIGFDQRAKIRRANEEASLDKTGRLNRELDILELKNSIRKTK